MTAKALARGHRICALLSAALVLSGCAAVVLEPGPNTAASRSASAAPAIYSVSVDAIDALDGPALRVPTGTDAPTPSFDASGGRIAFRTASHEDEHDHEVHQLDVLELAAGQLHIIEEWHDPGQTTDPYGYPTAYDPMGNPIVPARDRTWYPVFLGDSVVASVGEMANPYEVELAHRIAISGERSETFGTRGSRAVASPSGDRVFLQTTEGLAEFDAGGRLLGSHPGWEPAWAPDGRRFISLLSPFRDRGASWWSAGYGFGWPSEFTVPSEAVGGVVLHDGSTVRVLSDEGGGAVWLPDGQRLLIERRSAGTSVLAELDLDGQLVEIGPGSHAAVHPSGAFALFDGPDGLMVTASRGPGEWTAPRRVEIPGRRPIFSRDGGRLLVQAPTRERRGSGVDLVLYDLRALADGTVAAPVAAPAAAPAAAAPGPADDDAAPTAPDGAAPSDAAPDDDATDAADESPAAAPGETAPESSDAARRDAEPNTGDETFEPPRTTLMMADCGPTSEVLCEHVLALVAAENAPFDTRDTLDLATCVVALEEARDPLDCATSRAQGACVLAADTFVQMDRCHDL